MTTGFMVNELTRKGARSSNASQTIWEVPYSRNNNFVDREKALQSIHARFESERKIVLTGPGGIGKTQLALEYAYRYTSDYHLVCWIRSRQAAQAASDSAHLGASLWLPEMNLSNQSKIIHAVGEWLHEHEGWLCIVDDASDRDDIREDIFPSQKGRILISSRCKEWPGTAMTEVPALSLRASMVFLRQRLGVNEASAIKALSNRLACVPLALELAAAYIHHQKISVAIYRRLLTPALDNSDFAVEAAVSLSLNALSSESPEAYELLKQAAWFSSENIPLRALQIPTVEASAFMEKLSALQKYSLIEISGEAIRISRSIQEVMRRRLTMLEQRRSVAAAIDSLNRMFPSKTQDYRYWPACSRLLPHVVEAIDHAEQLKTDVESAPRLLNQAALYELRRGQLSQAERMLRLAMDIGVRVYAPSHHKLATYASNLSGVLKEQGNLDGALEFAQRALQIDEAVLGEEDVQIGIHSGNLGQILQSKGDLDKAFHFVRRALEISNKTHSEENRQSAVRNYNMGQIMRLRGDFEGAREFCSRAIHLAEKQFGSDHPQVADFAESLARIYWSIGDLISAEHQVKRALRINEQFYGEEHWKFLVAARHLDFIVAALAKRTNPEP